MKVTEQYSPVVLFIVMLTDLKVVLTLEYVSEIHSKEATEWYTV